jgi:adenosine deaminase
MESERPAGVHRGSIFGRIPKTELHLHIEGAIPPRLALELAREGTGGRIRTASGLREKLRFRDFEGFIRAWMWLMSLVREEEFFEELAYEALGFLSLQNVKYVEAHFSPGDFSAGRRANGLSEQGIAERLISGKERARMDFGIRCELIVDLVRNYGPEYGATLLGQMEPFLGKGIIGVGLGGSEDLYPADRYSTVFRKAKHLGFRLTAHAGELAGADSVWAAVKKLGVERIGHGTRAYEDPSLVRHLKEKRIPLEVCVTSNVRTGVWKWYRTHPIARYFREGLLVTANSDDPTFFDTNATKEYAKLAKKVSFGIEDLVRLSFNGIEASFMSEEDKAQFRRLFERDMEMLG